MPNRLANETSPYLLQHADNPVDWYPWGEEALQKAQSEEKPILLSIGYAACHWCHVMAHESFEDETTAVIMNEHFVNIKVDREERPDLDSIYMSAVQALTGSGGWPMTVFLTPDGKPFYGGTYYPPVPRYGMPSFRQVLAGVADAWQKRRDEVTGNAGKLAASLGQMVNLSGQEGVLDEGLFGRALDGVLRQFDNQEGGFGRAPKFPPSMTLEFLLRMYLMRADDMALHMAKITLEKMAYGGLYDQLGGGFARYSTDNRWLVPHFEKMLYDNALLARVYLHAYQVTGDPLLRRVVEETLDFVVREMRHEEGGFYSSYDADSEGEEGKFYVWSAQAVREVLGDNADLFMRFYGVTASGNWEGHSILNVQTSVAEALDRSVEDLVAELAPARRKLFEARAQRVWPGLDDKVLTAWNGLMLAAFAEAGRELERPDYTEVAVRNAQFLYDTMQTANGRLLRTWKAGAEAKYNAYLEDYAYLADGLLALYQTTFDERWFHWARALSDVMVNHFYDREKGGFFDTSDDHEDLLHRPKDVQDNATPSANAMAAHVLLKLNLYTGDGALGDIAEEAVSSLYGAMLKYPTGFAHWLCAAALMLDNPREVAIVGDFGIPAVEALIQTAFDAYRPHQVVAVGDGQSDIPLLQERPLVNERATAYVCRRFVCQTPVNTPDALAQQLEA